MKLKDAGADFQNTVFFESSPEKEDTNNAGICQDKMLFKDDSEVFFFFLPFLLTV